MHINYIPAITSNIKPSIAGTCFVNSTSESTPSLTVISIVSEKAMKTNTWVCEIHSLCYVSRFMDMFVSHEGGVAFEA